METIIPHIKMDPRIHEPFSPNRKKVLDDEIEPTVRLLKEYGSPEKVILFGTMASGDVHEWSDIDMVVIEQTLLPFYLRIKKVYDIVKPKVAMDIIVYTPEEFTQLCSERPFFREEILAKGKVIYEYCK